MQPSSADPAAQRANFSWEKQRILILDKDDQFRFMARTLFQRHKTSEVLSTASMAEAVLHLMAAPVSACLVGVAENEPAGVEFLRWLRDRKASPCPDVPVTALTDSKNPIFIQKICRFGVEGLLRKPVSQEGLTRRVSQMIIEPKRMVIAPGYLGQERRLKDAPFEGPERRHPSEPIFANQNAKPSSPPPAPTPKAAPAPAAPKAATPVAVQPPRPQAPASPIKPAAVSPSPTPAPTPAPAAPIPAAAPVVQAKPAAAAPPPPSSPPPAAKIVTPPASPTVSPAQAAYKPSGTGTKLDMGGDPAATPGLAKPSAPLQFDMPDTAPVIPVVVAAPPPPPPPPPPAHPVQTATPKPAPAPVAEKPKVTPAKLGFDLAAVLDSHRSWVLSRGTEGARATLARQNMTGVDLSGAVLTQADMTYCRMQGAECSEARLDGTDLRFSDLQGADLREAILGAARLRHVNLRGASLKGANLRGADLSGADLSGADLEGAQMHGAIMLDTVIGDADLSTAEGLTQSQINKAKRTLKTKLPLGIRHNLGEETKAPSTPAEPGDGQA